MSEPQDKTRWPRWYWALILVLLLQILFFSYLTYLYSA